jgi:hypothetical protein
MRVLATRAAGELAAVAEAAGNIELATQALRTGLDMVPACEPLWRAELELAAAHDPSRLPTVVDEMFAAIAEHGSPRGAEATTLALVEELLPGGGRPRVVQTA